MPAEITRTSDRRERREPAADLALGLVRHGVAAIRAHPGGKRLGLQPLEAGRLAGADIGVERRLVLARGEVADRIAAAQHGPARFQHQLVDQRLLRVERGIDPRHLVVGDDIAAAPLQRAEPLVVGILERLEGAHEFLEGGRDFRAGGLAFRGERARLHGVDVLFAKSEVIPAAGAAGEPGW